MKKKNWCSEEPGLVVIASGQKEEIVSSLVLRKASYSASNHSNKLTYRAISRNTGIPVQDLPAAMADRCLWCDVVQTVSVEAAG